MNSILERISRHAFFQNMSPDRLAQIARGAVELNVKPGDMIIREGEPANRFYLIESGGIALEAHEPADGTFPVRALTKGDVLGWSWLLSPFVWHFQARALEPSSLLSLDAGALLVAAEEDHDFGYELMKRTAHVLMGRLWATRRQLVLSQLKTHEKLGGECSTTSLEPRSPKGRSLAGSMY